MPSTSTRLTFTNALSGDAYLTNAVAHNGSGAAIGDVDGDGRPDLYLCNLGGPNRLFRNLGNWTFEPLSIRDADCAGQMSTGAVLADVDGDGDLDLLVNGIGAGTRLFQNDGRGHFTELTDCGLSRSASATSMALADMDGDGDLDLYVAHYIDFMHLVDPTTNFAMSQQRGRWVVSKVNDVPATTPRLKDRFEVMPDGEVREIPEADALYRNDGNGHFTAIEREPGTFLDESGRPVPPPRDWGMAVVFRDLNGDGTPDLYVSNDYASPDRLWLNDGRGHFRLAPPLSLPHTAYNAMGIDVADVDRDGVDDLVVLDLLSTSHARRMRQLGKLPPDAQAAADVFGRPQYNRNMLFLGQPGGRYVETGLMAGVAATDWSWCPAFVDVDLDGYEDLLVTTGFEYDLMDQDSHDRMGDAKRRLNREQLKRWMQYYPKWRTRSHAFRNRGDGTFEPKSDTWNLGADSLSFGMAMGDLDNDGDLDVVINRINEAVGVYRNEATAGRIGIQLHGRAPNTSGTGARVRLLGPTITQGQEMMCGGRYLSGDQSLRVFATDLPRTNGLEIEVRWRNGSLTRVTNVEPNRIYAIDEPGAPPAPAVAKAAPAPLFADVSALLNHFAAADPFDDSSLQPLVPRRLSGLGTGVAWLDLDGDGWDDLVLGAPRGGHPSVFINRKGESFAPNRLDAVANGQRGLAGWSDGRGSRRWLASATGYGPSRPAPSQVQVGDANRTAAVEPIEVGPDAVGPLAVGDVDGDGDLDVFVGAQSRPGRYPESGRSQILINQAGKLTLAAATNSPLCAAGFVQGATLVDLDGDGDLDLALAVEWGPVRVYRNSGGQFEEVTGELGLASRTGWWSGIVAGDFDSDGRMDLAVGNAGRNTAYALFQPGPIRIYIGEWNAPGTLDAFEAWHGGDAWWPVKNRRLLSALLPDLDTRFPTHEAYGHATLPQILGAQSNQTRFLEASEFESGIYLNRGSKFEWRPLPREAQLSPVFSVNVADFDGDGFEDLFLSQNRSDLLPELSRDDAGRGLCLRGRGDGTFITLGADESGIDLPGELRSAALGDFNHDGRVDVVVTSINGPTRLLANQRGRPGLRVVINGPLANPDAIGAQLRVRFRDGTAGPVRAIQGGSGFGGSDSTSPVLGVPRAPASVWVRWPGGKEQVIDVPEGQTGIRLRYVAK